MAGATKKYRKPENPKYRGGRKPFQPTEEQRKMVRVMVAGGIGQREIAPVLGIDRNTLMRHFRDELDHGAIKANVAVVANLFNQTKHNTRAAEFWLTNRDPSRWQNRQVFDGRIKVEDNRPSLSALSNDQLAVLRQAAAILRGANAPKQIEGIAHHTNDDDDAAEDETE